MKVGEYVRFKTLSREIKIGKVIEIIEPDKESMKKYCVYDLDNNEATVDDYVIKSSPNIIDLIEVGDYVNGLPVESVCGTRWDENDLRVWLAVATKYKKEYGVENSEGNYEFETLYRCIKPENIKSIVTKEAFESMEYRIGDD